MAATRIQTRCGCRSVGAAADRYGGNQGAGQVWVQERRCSSRWVWRQPGYRPGAAVSDKPGQDQSSGSGTREQVSG
ncbi:unnamed protein product [Staurois parvus]|uniref:Uncharacterized protein n=1 Tax=Staurois parvus TaxID=386267 RepID=A0ABN9EK96_9NEOB|nr:unnamed protein product [Staurois parvus]